jgi:GNAT superfamily N-acetyltransferase
MADDLDIHPASESERTEAFNNLHDVWSGGRSVEEHLRHRLTYPKHRNADWYVGCVGGRVVVGLGCYRIDFRVRGRLEPGYAFGEVHTRAECRGRGFAPRLLAWVEDHQKSQGREIGMLYSDIDPGYYARLGYVMCPSHEGWTDPKHSTAQPSSSCLLVPFVGPEELTGMAAIYTPSHSKRAVSIARSPAYWEYLVSRDPKNEFFWATNSAGARLGYARIAFSPEELKIRDVALVDEDETRRRDLLVELFRLGRERGVKRVGGWMADMPLHRALFTLQPRRREITMLKSLRAGITIDSQLATDVDHFQEMDHV